MRAASGSLRSRNLLSRAAIVIGRRASPARVVVAAETGAVSVALTSSQVNTVETSMKTAAARNSHWYPLAKLDMAMA
jgi:hypothetical protein